jgi:sugar diacid utilization regulator
MDKKYMLEGVDERKKELVEKVGTLLGKEKATQRYHVNRDINVLVLVGELLNAQGNEVKLSEKAQKAFLQLTEPQVINAISVEVKPGERILDVMARYSEVKNLLPRMQKAAVAINCVVNFNSGMIEYDRGTVIADSDTVISAPEIEADEEVAA